MRFGGSVLFLALALAAGAAQAGGAGVRIGTTGLGVDLGWEIAPTLGGRIGVSGGSYSTNVDTDDFNYDAKLKLGNVNAFLDWSPFGPLRITGGLIPNNNKIDVSGQSKTNPLVSVSGNVKPDYSVAPYLGIGYGNVWTKGVNFYFDLGVMFMGSPKASLQANCGAATGTPACALAQSQAETERQRLEDELRRFKYYPVANIGITIGF
jgi:hypothetical protein